MKKILIILTLLTLAACAGRPERTIRAHRDNDENLSCAKITEFHRNNENLVDRKLRQRQATQNKNVKVTAVAVIFFTPLLLATDLRDVEKNEILGLKRRNEVLREMASEKGCATPPVRHGDLYAALGK